MKKDELSDKDISVLIGNRIRNIRKNMHLTQKIFAANAKISSSYLSEIENGSKRFTARTLFKICNGNDISADKIILQEEKSTIDILVDKSIELDKHEIDRLITYLNSLKAILPDND